jgi:hypothetical protein
VGSRTARKLRLGPLPKTESVKLTFSCVDADRKLTILMQFDPKQFRA